MSRARRCVAGCAVGLLLASCAADAGPPPFAAGSSPAPATAAVASTAQAEAAEATEAAVAAEGEFATSSVPPLPSRSAGATAPFSTDDLLPSSGLVPPKGLQRALGLSDRPGPLLPFLGSALGFEYEVTDRCDAVDQQDREEPGCGRERFSVRSSNGVQYYGTLQEARNSILQRKYEAARATTLPHPTYSLGFSALWDEPFRTVFAPWDAPVDEVGVLVETVAVRGGVLRGLVRNWSRHLWAYEVTVGVGGHAFVWPLSVQPGEIAPFEIHSWDGPADADAIEFTVDADMTWHVDPSRAFESGDGPTLWVGTTTQRRLPESLRQRYPMLTADIAADSVSLGIAHWYTGLLKPASHPSIAGEIGDYHASPGHLVVDDLRGYGAVFDYAGRVLDVGPAILTDLRQSLVRAAPPDFEVRSVPDPGLRQPLPYSLDVLFDVHVAEVQPGEGVDEYFYANRKDIAEEGEIAWYRSTYDGGFVLWIGAAFPTQPAS